MGRSRKKAWGSLSADNEENVRTYSQRTIKDVNTAVYTNLTAPVPPQKGEQAGEKRVEMQSTLLEVKLC